MANERKEHSTADPFWDDSSEQLLAAEIAATLMTKDKPTFADVLDLHFSLKIEESGCGITTSLDPMFRKIEKAAPDCYAITCWRTFKEAAPETKSQGLFHQIQKEVTFCGLPHGADA